MNAEKLISLVKGLGRTYKELIAENLIRNEPLRPLFKEGENEDLIQKVEPGMELWFWEKTERLERITVTLASYFEGETVYVGELPLPFTHKMDQPSVHARLGVPDRSLGPTKLPLPIGMTGGWDAYRLDGSLHQNAEVAIQFGADKVAVGLAFRLIDTGHD
ncbi:DUF6392 family protein [Pseudomonas putida]|uniref:Pyocin immunity protein n=1 Tax=Pseudomonas putida TaxID=303 RepID=A0A1Q9R489_PSEPU|nr:DUF6392 family protein [Pseudomonas putida]OLS62230.1 hypothetical protein PSEMO_31410 [Pseudomonas putida]